MFRPAGGSISNLWIEDHDYKPTSKQEYYEVGAMHFPEAENVSFNSRNRANYKVIISQNLFEFDAQLILKIIR
ncbi:MAG: hypothetical protein H6611_03700 [Ignavibacteriales bacterium]|nr:hypothetical protein [Ignavibacteriales bacterium]